MSGIPATNTPDLSLQEQPTTKRVITVAVAGNPNAGKSTLINALAGSRLHVGNWPGVTVEKKEAKFEFNGRTIRLVDLPGTYSLSPYTQEEIIARDYLLHNGPDLVINVVDATNLERNLYLTVQLLELGIPTVMALNIFDEAEAKGYRIDVAGMEQMLGISVIPTTATRQRGLHELLCAVLATADAQQEHKPRQLSYGADLDQAIDWISQTLTERHPHLAKRYPLRWLACKLMEGDAELDREINVGIDEVAGDALHHLRRAHGEDLEALMADARYGLANGLTREVLHRPELRKMELTEKIDRIVLNRFLGIPIFLAAMWLMFKLTFDLSSPFGDWLDGMIAGPFRRWVEAGLSLVGAPDWTVSLALDGVIAGVGFVLVFVPVIFAMMFFITFLEGSGYMARAAFVMDRAMHAIGLHGKSFIPMLLGFGCNVPGIYATRTLENPRDKALTALLIPLMSCGARLPVYVLFAGVFFGAASRHGDLVAVRAGDRPGHRHGDAFQTHPVPRRNADVHHGAPPLPDAVVQEPLPAHLGEGEALPDQGRHLHPGGLGVCLVPAQPPLGVESKRDSYLGQAGAAVAPIFEPLGFGTWEASASLITGLIAKEIVVGTMGEIYLPGALDEAAEEGPAPTLGEDLKEIVVSFGGAFKEAGVNVVGTFGVSSLAAEEAAGDSPLKSAVRGAFTPLSAYAMMAFVLLYMPCVVVAIAMRQEFGSWKWFGLAFAYQSVLAWGVALIIYQGGRLLGLGG
jgi:ferrous iron transport protein B